MTEKEIEDIKAQAEQAKAESQGLIKQAKAKHEEYKTLLHKYYKALNDADRKYTGRYFRYNDYYVYVTGVRFTDTGALALYGPHFALRNIDNGKMQADWEDDIEFTALVKSPARRMFSFVGIHDHDSLKEISGAVFWSMYDLNTSTTKELISDLIKAHQEVLKGEGDHE